MRYKETHCSTLSMRAMVLKEKKKEGFISVALVTKIIVYFLVRSELINITRA